MRHIKVYVLIALAQATLYAQVIATAGYVSPAPVSLAPGQVVTFFLTGIHTLLPGPDRVVRAKSLPLPTTLAGISASIIHVDFAPIPPVRLFSVQQINTCVDKNTTNPACFLTAVTVQVPFELAHEVETLVFVPTRIVFSENGVPGPDFEVTRMFDRVHILTSCDATLSSQNCVPRVTHRDGTPVTKDKPAAAGETVTMWAYGLGLPQTLVPDGEATPAPGTPTFSTFRLRYNFGANLSPSEPSRDAVCAPAPAFTGLTPGFVSLYQINVFIPSTPEDIPACNDQVRSNLTVSVGAVTFDGAGICVEPGKPNPANTFLCGLR